jgi:hypothetical protein
MEENIDRVGYLLGEAKPCLEFRLVIPQNFVLAVTRIRDGAAIIPESVLRNLYFVGCSLVIEAGAYLEGADMSEILTGLGTKVMCLPGSFLNLDDMARDDEAEVTELKRWGYSDSSLDYMSYIATLWDEEETISINCLGGKANRSPGKSSVARNLKAFGGCRFMYHEGWACENCCTWFPMELAWNHGYMRCGFCGFLNGGRRWWVWREGIKLKGEARARRLGFIN